MSNNETIQKARTALAQRDFKKSLELLTQVLSREPANFEARYTLAVLRRTQGDHAVAKQILLELLAITPDFGRGFQELAFCELGLNKISLAQDSFQKAVELDASLIDSWQYVLKLYTSTNDSRANHASRQIKFLSELPQELRTVISYLSSGRIADAERLCRFFMQKNKTHIEGMRLMAEIATRTGVFDDAEFLLETVMELDPAHEDAEIQLINVLLRRQRFHKAHSRSRSLYEAKTKPASNVQALYASACFGIANNAEAIRVYNQMIKASPKDPVLRVSLGHIYNSIGKPAEAVNLFKQAYNIRSTHGDAYWSLANTKSYQFSDKELASMIDMVAKEAISELDQIQLNFALGKAYEDRSDFTRSFEYYSIGNDQKRSSSTHSAGHLDIRVSSQIEICTRELFTAWEGSGHRAEDPIFIVGLPRAGSTLLEQILASHSMVDGTMELHDILDLAKRLRGRDKAGETSPRYPRILRDLNLDNFEKFGAQYINDTNAYRGSAPRFIDKMPNNFFHIGLIRLILPRAKIIDARRHPMSCCFSGFKQLFGEGQEFTYGLEEIGNYYRQYIRLMDHWDKVLPGFVLRVQHENVVNNLEIEVKRLLDFCGLPFESACLEFHKTERSVKTPSAEQVRQPIYRSGLDQWRNYENHLDPLKKALGDDLLNTFEIEAPR